MEVERFFVHPGGRNQDLFSEEYYVNVSQRGIVSLVSDLGKVSMLVGKRWCWVVVWEGGLLSNGGLVYRESTVVKRCLPAARGTDCAMRDSGIAGAGWQGRKVRSTCSNDLAIETPKDSLREHTDCMNFY